MALVAGDCYTFHVDACSNWTDLQIVTDANGWISNQAPLEYGDWFTEWRPNAAAQRRIGLNWSEPLAKMNAIISALGVAILKRNIHQQYLVRCLPLPTIFLGNTATTAVQFASRSLE